MELAMINLVYRQFDPEEMFIYSINLVSASN